MNSRQALDSAVLTGAVAFTRFAFRSHYLYDVDSVNFALALEHFAPSVHQPHPPGYFLYVCLGRLANAVFHDANAALVAVSILASCGAVAMIYALADNWFGRSEARFASLIFLFSPLIWFHGTVALSYVVEAFFSALAGYLCWRVYCGASGFIVTAAVIVGLAAGFRPSSLLFLGPLWLFSFRSAARRQAAAGAGALALTLLAWFIPMIRESGGLSAYISSLLSLWRLVPSKQTVFNSPVWNSIARFCSMAGIYVLCFGCAALLPARVLRRSHAADRRKKVFTWIWTAPGLVFFTFVYLKFVNSGYLLVLSPPVCAWLGLWASRWYADLRLGQALKRALIGSCAAANVAMFLGAPVYCSYREVRKFEAELENVLRVLPQIASSRETMIVGFDSHFL
jgi:4-amino-4-deoxy-L-arabinose transferase-like glycosyltransferase